MEKTKRDFDAIVVGAGISGLLAALVLSKEGKKVLVIEQNSCVGGNCRSYKVGGYAVDTGPHAITELISGPLVFFMDKYFARKPVFVPINNYYARDNGKFEEIPLTFPKFFRFDILSRRDRFFTLLALGEAMAWSVINKKYLEKSIYEYIRKYHLSTKTLRLIDAIALFLSGRPMQETPMWRLLYSAGYVEDGGRESQWKKIRKLFKNDYADQGYPLGGIQSITDCLVSSLPKEHVEIRTVEKLSRLIVEGRTVNGIETDKDKYFARIVIYSGSVKELPNFTDALSAEYVTAVGKIKQANSLTLWLGFSKIMEEFSYKGSELYFDTDTQYWAMPISSFDPSLAPAGKQLVGFTTIIKTDNLAEQVRKLKDSIFKEVPDCKRYIEFEHTQIIVPEKGAVTVDVKFPSPRSPIRGLYLVGTDTDMRSMGLTRAAYSVMEATKFMREDRIT